MKKFTKIAAVLFAVITVLNVIRVIYGWEVNIGSVTLPVWVSAIGALLAGILSWGLCKESK